MKNGKISFVLWFKIKPSKNNMEFVTWFENLLKYLSELVPLEVFTLAGTFIEEIIAPIPSPFVMTLVGTLAETQGRTFGGMVVLAVLGSFSKTVGSYFIYLVSDKLEDFFVPRFGKFFGVTHESIESIGKKIEESWREDFFIFIARVLPFMPGSPISVVCGILKINLKTYIISTFLGNIFRNMIFLYIGYVGMSSFHGVMGGIDSLESIFSIIILVVLVGLLAVGYIKRNKNN